MQQYTRITGSLGFFLYVLDVYKQVNGNHDFLFSRCFNSLCVCANFVKFLERVIGPSQGLYQTNIRKTKSEKLHTFMPIIGFGTTILVFQRPKGKSALEQRCQLLQKMWCENVDSIRLSQSKQLSSGLS